MTSSQNSPKKATIYAKAYLNKAKNANDKLKIANGYSIVASIVNPEIALKYSDSIIQLTRNLNSFKHPGYGFMIKGMCYYNLNYYEEALKYFIIANKYATEQKNMKQLFYLKSSIGKIKNYLGKNNEALESFKSTLKILNKKKSNFNNQHQLYLGVLFDISNCFLIDKKYDSAMNYVNLGIQKSLYTNDSIFYFNFVSQSGIIAYYQNNFKIAIDSLDKSIPYESEDNGFLNYHYYKGNIYYKQNNDSKAFYHFKKADSIYNATNDIVSEVREIQEYFVNYYKNIGDTENQLVYIDRLLKVDSILNANYKNLNEILIKKYDTPILLAQKENIIDNLKAKHQNSTFTILGLTVILIVFIIFFMWYNYKQRTINKNPNNFVIVNKQPIEVKPQTKLVKESITISKEIIKSVLNSLNEFEANHEYLENKLTLNKLSKKLNTNSNYLSKIINTEKQMNFSSYISNLRLEYCLEKMKTDSKFRKYTITAIAFEIGFNNVESFSKAFYKKTNTYPSSYIKEIEKSTVT